jgi:Fe-S-cluster formation regulator IscX/YfhJ
MESLESSHSEMEPRQDAFKMRLDAQRKLAEYACQQEHPDLDEKSVHAVAMKEWIGDPDAKDSLAARFARYFDDHPNMHIDTDNPDDMAHLLEEVKTYEPTKH